MTAIVNTLRVDASARHGDSVSRQLGDALLEQLHEHTTLELQTRDLSQALPIVDANWVAANNTALEQRNPSHHETLALSDSLVEQLEAANLLIITTPIYNFGVPAALKAWIDLIARAGRTFRYTENGPVGLLQNTRAIVIVTSGGTQVGSDIDFATPYLRHVLGFVGIHEVDFVAADRLGKGAEEAITDANRKLTKLARTVQ
jgi:FMN-dependent NADH-azoreductase